MANHTCTSCKKSFSSYVKAARFCSRGCYYVARKKRFTPVADRFWKKVRRGADGECWAWVGATHKYGYGRMSVGTSGNWRVAEAHCVSWELHNGPIPDGQHVCHSCDNPPCCNPAHLFLGTNNDNRQDSVRKGRHAHGDTTGARLHPETAARGSKCPWAKLTEEIVLVCRAAHKSGTTVAKLARERGVSYMVMKNAVFRITWKHVA